MTGERQSDVDEEERAQQMGVRGEGAKRGRAWPVYIHYAFKTPGSRTDESPMIVGADESYNRTVYYTRPSLVHPFKYIEPYKPPYANLRARARQIRRRVCAGGKDPRLHLQTVKAVNEHAKPRGTNLIQLGNCERF